MVTSIESLVIGKFKQDDDVSEFKVLHSFAGYYIGRTIDDLPYSRDSEYFETKEIAETFLVARGKIAIGLKGAHM